MVFVSFKLWLGQKLQISVKNLGNGGCIKYSVSGVG